MTQKIFTRLFSCFWISKLLKLLVLLLLLISNICVIWSENVTCNSSIKVGWIFFVVNYLRFCESMIHRLSMNMRIFYFCVQLSIDLIRYFTVLFQPRVCIYILLNILFYILIEERDSYWIVFIWGMRWNCSFLFTWN